MANKNEILHLNVGGKKYAARRQDLCAVEKSRLHDWFKSAGGRSSLLDKAGNVYIDRDGKHFRHVLMYLRAKREKHCHPASTLPMAPDELAGLMGEAVSLGLTDLAHLCTDMLGRYKREENGYVVAYTNYVLQRQETFSSERAETRVQSGVKTEKAKDLDYDGW